MAYDNIKCDKKASHLKGSKLNERQECYLEENV